MQSLLAFKGTFRKTFPLYMSLSLVNRFPPSRDIPVIPFITHLLPCWGIISGIPGRSPKPLVSHVRVAHGTPIHDAARSPDLERWTCVS